MLDPSDCGFGVTARGAVGRGAGAVLLVGAGVLARAETEPFPSPNLDSVSADRFKSSLSPRSTISFRRSLVNPISLSAAILASNESVVTSATGAPRPRSARSGPLEEEGGDQRSRSGFGEALDDLVPNRRRFEVEADPRRPKPKNLLPVLVFSVLGGRGGGDPSGDLDGDLTGDLSRLDRDGLL